MVKSDAVTDQKVGIVVRARCRRCKITDQFTALVELSAPLCCIFNYRSCLREKLLSLFCSGDIFHVSAVLGKSTVASLCFLDKNGFLICCKSTDASAYCIICQKCGTYRCRERKTCDSEDNSSV